jgi:hypothetical protein
MLPLQGEGDRERPEELSELEPRRRAIEMLRGGCQLGAGRIRAVVMKWGPNSEMSEGGGVWSSARRRRCDRERESQAGNFNVGFAAR